MSVAEGELDGKLEAEGVEFEEPEVVEEEDRVEVALLALVVDRVGVGEDVPRSPLEDAVGENVSLEEAEAVGQKVPVVVGVSEAVGVALGRLVTLPDTVIVAEAEEESVVLKLEEAVGERVDCKEAEDVGEPELQELGRAVPVPTTEEEGV